MEYLEGDCRGAEDGVADKDIRKPKRRSGRSRARFNRWLRKMHAGKDEIPDTEKQIHEPSTEVPRVSFVYQHIHRIAPLRPQWQVAIMQEHGQSAWFNYPPCVNELLEATRLDGKAIILKWKPKGHASCDIDTYLMLQRSNFSNCCPIRRILVETLPKDNCTELHKIVACS